jgi:hypothetical protein
VSSIIADMLHMLHGAPSSSCSSTSPFPYTKDGTGTKAHTRPDPEKFFPTKVRMPLIQVSAGAKYDPTLVPNLPPAGEKK